MIKKENKDNVILTSINNKNFPKCTQKMDK